MAPSGGNATVRPASEGIGWDREVSTGCYRVGLFTCHVLLTRDGAGFLHRLVGDAR